MNPFVKYDDIKVNGKPSKPVSPLQATGHYGVFAPSGTGLLEYSFRASPGGTYGSGHSSHQQTGGYSGKRNKFLEVNWPYLTNVFIMILGLD